METDEQIMLGDVLSVADFEDAHVREVYARFGLAIYYAQVFEHGIVNAITILDLIPNRRHLARSQKQWEEEVDTFMNSHLEKTMGSMIRVLMQVTEVDSNLETKLRAALIVRNRLVHSFFRDNDEALLTALGRHLMLKDIDEASETFKAADSAIEEVIAPIRIRFGITDALIREEYEKILGMS